MLFLKQLIIRVLLLAVLCCVNSLQAETKNNPADRKPIVQTDNGKIQGSTLQSRLGVLFYAFRGIRYGKAPIGDLRFKVS